MRKTKFAALLSLCMAPAMLWSTDSQAVPSWARKYNVSCYMCHAGFPQRNAVGEAFQNNGYRFPGAQEEAFTKQKNVKIGNDEWKKESPNAPATGSYPQFNTLSMTLAGTPINYAASQSRQGTSGTAPAGKIFNWSAPASVSLFYAGSLGDNFTFLGQIGGISGSTATASKVTSNARVIYRITPGLNFATGSSFSPAGNANWNGVGNGGVTNVTSLLPSPTNYAELQLTQGEKGGFAILAGTSLGVAPIDGAAANTVDDTKYVRAKVKLIGAGMLSGANGELGDSYLGLDNQLNLGFGLSTAKNAATATGFSGNFVGETLVYGGDIQGVYKNALVGVAVSRDRDLKMTSFKAEAGYFIYPWLYAKLSYSDLALYSPAATSAPLLPAYRLHNPSITPSVTAWIAPNMTLVATYVSFNDEWKESPALVGSSVPANYLSNINTFKVAFQAAF